MLTAGIMLPVTICHRRFTMVSVPTIGTVMSIDTEMASDTEKIGGASMSIDIIGVATTKHARRHSPCTANKPRAGGYRSIPRVASRGIKIFRGASKV